MRCWLTELSNISVSIFYRNLFYVGQSANSMNRIFFVAAIVIALLFGFSDHSTAQDKQFLLSVSEQPFAGKPFQYRFWLQRQQDNVAAMELIVLLAERDKVDPQQLYSIRDLSEVTGHKRVRLMPYQDQGLKIEGHSTEFNSNFPDRWYGSIKTQAFSAIPKDPVFVYQLVVTQKDRKIVRLRAKSTSINASSFERIQLANRERLVTTPATELMVEQKDWLKLTKGVTIPKPKVSKKSVCDLKNQEQQQLAFSAPIASWTNSGDGKYLYVLQADGLLCKINWQTMVVEQFIRIPGKGTEVGLTKSYIVATDASNKRVWCLDRKTMAVEQVIPIDHANRIAADRNSETCLVFNGTDSSLIDLDLPKVTHSFSSRAFEALPTAAQKYNAPLWFAHDKLWSRSIHSFRIEKGNLIGEKPNRFSSGRGRNLLAVSPSGDFVLFNDENAAMVFETKYIEFPIRTFRNTRNSRFRPENKTESPEFDKAQCAAISENGESILLGMKKEIVLVDMDGKKAGAYPIDFSPEKVIASPTGDFILAATDSKSFLLPVKMPKSAAIVAGKNLKAAKIPAELADIKFQSVGLLSGSLDALNLDFKSFVQNAVFRPDGDSFFVVDGEQRLLEINVDELQVKRVIELKTKVKDFAATSKGLAVLLESTPKVVVLNWESLQIDSTMRIDGAFGIAGHPNSKFLLAWRQANDPLRVFDLDRKKLVTSFQTQTSLRKRSGEKFEPPGPGMGTYIRWPTEISKYSFNRSGTSIIGRYRQQEVVFSLSVDGIVDIESLVPIPGLRTRLQSEYELVFQDVGDETRIFDNEQNELAVYKRQQINLPKFKDRKGFGGIGRQKFDGWTRSPNGKKLIAFGSHCVVFDLATSTNLDVKSNEMANGAATNPAGKKVANVEPAAETNGAKSAIGPTPSAIWRQLRPVVTSLKGKEAYKVNCHESVIFVSKRNAKDKYKRYEVLTFSLETKQFLPEFRTEEIAVTQDGKYILYDVHNSRGGRTTHVLNSNFEKDGTIEPGPREVLPIPYYDDGDKKSSSVFLSASGSTTIFDIDAKTNRELAEGFVTLDYHINSNRILAYQVLEQDRKKRGYRFEAASELFWLDPVTGAVEEKIQFDFLADEALVEACCVSHSGNLMIVQKTKDPSCAIIDTKNKKVLWEGNVGRVSGSNTRWSRNDALVLIGDKLLIDPKKGKVIEGFGREYKKLKLIPNTDYVAGLLSDDRTVNIIDPINKRIVRSIAKRAMVRIHISDPSEKKSVPIKREFEEIKAWDFTRDGKFLVTYGKGRSMPYYELNFHLVETGEHVQGFRVPRF